MRIAGHLRENLDELIAIARGRQHSVVLEGLQLEVERVVQDDTIARVMKRVEDTAEARRDCIG